MDRFFASPDGRLFACFPGAEERPGQRRMAECVFDAIQEGRLLGETWRRGGAEAEERPLAVIQAVEAGTGTGKSLGYLLPALEAGRLPVVVATRTKQLQRQLLQEDVPRASGILGRPVKAVLAKGRSNYLCKAAWELAEGRQDLELDRADFGLWQALGPWAKATETGDREELGRHGEGESELWDRLNARAERCTGKQCPRYEDCFRHLLTQAGEEAVLVAGALLAHPPASGGGGRGPGDREPRPAAGGSGAAGIGLRPGAARRSGAGAGRSPRPGGAAHGILCRNLV